MPDTLSPILRVKDGMHAATWYARLGFQIAVEHRFAPGMPVYLILKRGDVCLHLSEHLGDARPDTLVYLSVDDVDAIAAEFGVEIEDQPWAREIQLADPDDNRWRIGAPRQ